MAICMTLEWPITSLNKLIYLNAMERVINNIFVFWINFIHANFFPELSIKPAINSKLIPAHISSTSGSSSGGGAGGTAAAPAGGSSDATQGQASSSNWERERYRILLSHCGITF